MHRLLLAAVLFAGAASAFAQDTTAAREVAADRYLKVAPMSRMLDDMVSEIGKQLPPEKRASFERDMKLFVRADSLERIARTAMIKHFTTDELNALADFYGSKNGASAMKKFGVYMADVMPEIQAEVQRGIQQINSGRK